MENYLNRAKILIEAFPYFKEFSGKTIVVKYGGKAMMSSDLKNNVSEDIVLMKYVGINPVLVHGGGPDIDGMLKKIGKKIEFYKGLRVTDEETMQITEMVLTGKIGKDIVLSINLLGGKAMGLSGKDGNLIIAHQTKKKSLGLVGEVEKINTELIHHLTKGGYIPVISSIGVDNKGITYNINADTVAAEIATELKAEKLIFLTDVEGIYEDGQNKKNLISELTIKEAKGLIKNQKVSRGMLPKLKGCIKAVESGVDRAHIIDGRLPHALLIELFTDKGLGTMVRK